MKATSSTLFCIAEPQQLPPFQVNDERRAGAVRINSDEACLVSLPIQAGKPCHHRPVHRRPVQRQNHWHRRFLVVAFRDMNEVSAVQAPYGESSGLPGRSHHEK